MMVLFVLGITVVGTIAGNGSVAIWVFILGYIWAFISFVFSIGICTIFKVKD
jgi:hypothetical protein